MADVDIPFLLTLGKPETQTLGGVGNWNFFRTIDIKEMADIFQFFHNGQHWYSISVDTQKTGVPNFGGVSNWKFFCMIDIKEMAAIFQFFHNGWHWYSVSVNTRKTGDPNFWGVSTWKFFCMIDIKEMAAIFQFFHNGRCWYSALRNPETKNSVDSVFRTFPLVQFSPSPILGSISTWMHGYA